MARMAKGGKRTEYWKEAPDERDFPAARDYLSLLFSEGASEALVEQLRVASTVKRTAKDLLRASRLPLLPSEDSEVAKDLKRVAKGDSLSPVLLVRGQAAGDVPLIVADGYHRICASYYLSEDADIPCRIGELD
jgi:hypothetical protein